VHGLKLGMAEPQRKVLLKAPAIEGTIETFTLSDEEARKIRRGAFLPLFLILPLAVMFGLDPSKSQPTHFIITFLIGVVCAAVVVSIGRHAAKGRIAEFSKTSATIGDGKLVLTSGMGQSDLDLGTVASVAVQQKKDIVRSVIVKFADGRRVVLQGYADMNALLKALRLNVPNGVVESEK